jgi:hypothetical protein
MADEVDSGGTPSEWAGPATAGSRAQPPRPDHDPAPGDQPEDADDHRRGRIGPALVTLIGAISLVCGLTWVLLNLHGPEPFVDLAAGVVLSLGGLVLLMDHRIQLPARATGIAAAVAAIGGTAAGIAVKTTTVCCTYAYVVDRGFPFFWLQRGGIADDPGVAQRLAATDSWHVDVSGLALNLFLWAHVGVLVITLVVLVRRATARR